MSIRKYNTYCRYYSYKKLKDKNSKMLNNPIKNIQNQPWGKGKKILTCLAITALVLFGVKTFFSLSIMSLGLKGENKFNENAVENSRVVQEIKKDSNLSESDVIEIEGLSDIKDELQRISSENESIEVGELSLKFQRKSDEKIQKVSGSLNSGETLYQYLVKQNISPAEILRLQELVQPVVDISRLNAGTKFSVHYDFSGQIVQFDYQPNQLDAYYIKIPQSGIEDIEVEKDEIFKEIVCFEGIIQNSLYQSMLDYCNSGQLAIQIAEIFAWDIDFLTECQPGDTFKIMVEKLYRGDFYRWGDILAVIYEGEMLSTHIAILFEDPQGNGNYYDENGQCLRKAFLKAPLNYKYISSHYTESRYHPILRIYRPHLAIDYAAPTGTPIVSIGAGTVISRYYDQGGYGNYVEIRHPNGYVTGYGHLSKFAAGLQVGQRVEQGEVIGYVGATGLATGPHLDFSISKDGRRVNFLEIDSPPAASVSADYLDDFNIVKKNYLSILKENG